MGRFTNFGDEKQRFLLFLRLLTSAFSAPCHAKLALPNAISQAKTNAKLTNQLNLLTYLKSQKLARYLHKCGWTHVTSFDEWVKNVQFGLSATASFPGFDLAGEITTSTNGAKPGQPGEGGTGFEALLAALVGGNANSPTTLNIKELNVDGVSPESQDIIDALAGMAEALVPLANAFDKLQIPTTEQLNQAQAALGKLVQSINAHPNRPELSIKGPIGSFAAQLSQLQKAGNDANKEGASDFAKVGNLMERLDKLLSQMTGAAPNPGQDGTGEKPALSIHQMVDRLNQLAQKLPALSAQFWGQLSFGNSILEAQTSNEQKTIFAAGQADELREPAPERQQASTPAIKLGTVDGSTPKTQPANLAVTPLTQNALTAQKQAAPGARQQSTTLPTGDQTTLQQVTAGTQSTTPVPTNSQDGAEPDVLAQLATLGQQQNTEAKKLQNAPTTAAFSDALANDEGTDAQLPRMTFAQATREANLQANNAYPEANRQALAAAATAPLPTELDAVETGTEKLLAQHKIDTFQQQTNLIDAAKSQTAGRQVNIPGVAFEIVRQFRAGMQRFEVRLDPPEMGRIEVRMEVDGNNVTARMVVERAETLDLLQRDARVLERALQQAGLNAERANLQFSLKQDGQSAGQNFQNQGREQNTSKSAALDASIEEQTRLSETTIYRGTTGPGGLNLWV
ncbi:flagellar hook-length control protein FliK [uncultured Maritalea sp.]|uniref:flagellar hook-length control protein FliK n=2 Tax=Alphaproteobacteria TaxID=28211 RepID=UPI00260A2CA4|nr:flagellar hook-length control protein FliK [uncultured Maritalea sp.]